MILYAFMLCFLLNTYVTALINCSIFFAFIVGVASEVSLIHPDDAYWFITLDETHHKLSSEDNKGGMTELCWCNPCFPCSGDRTVSTHNHFTGLYTYNLKGESLPHLYIFEKNPRSQTTKGLIPRCERDFQL